MLLTCMIPLCLSLLEKHVDEICERAQAQVPDDKQLEDTEDTAE